MMQREPLQSNLPASDAAPGVTLLVEKAREGDRVAFSELINIFHEPVFRMVYCRTRTEMDAEDLTQEIFMQAFKSLQRLNDSSRFKPWLFSIAVNRVRDYHRKKRFLSLLGLGGGREDESGVLEKEIDPNPSALDKMLRNEFWRHVKALSQRLSHWEREVFFLRFMDQFSIIEIAQALNKSESTVKTHLYRAVQKFKDSPLARELSGELP